MSRFVHRVRAAWAVLRGRPVVVGVQVSGTIECGPGTHIYDTHIRGNRIDPG